MAIVCIFSWGNWLPTLFNSARSAQMPTGKLALSWLEPIIIVLELNLAAAPTLKLE